MRSLLLLRHAATEAIRPGFPDRSRRLTSEGEHQAVAVGDHLRDRATPLDLVLASPATRAQQTAAALRVGAPVVISDPLYDAGGDEIIDLLRGLGDDVHHVLVVAHAPGLPAVVHALADPEHSDPAAMATVEWRFPAGTLATMSIEGPWPGLDRAVLVSARLP